MNIVIDEQVVAGYQTALADSLKLLVDVKGQFTSLQKQAEADRLMNIQEACQYMRRNEDTLINYTKGENGLPYFKKGQSKWFRKGDIDEWLAGGYVNRHQR